MRALLLATLVLAFAPTLLAEAHVDRSSTDPCPPNDIRWWFDHWHQSCCTPSWWCVLAADVEPLSLAVPTLP